MKVLEQEEVRQDLREMSRMTVNVPIFVFDQADEHMKRPKMCTLLDIGAGGCCISSEDSREEGEALRLRIRFGNGETMDLVGEVIWVIKCEDEKFRCGILFAQLREAEHEALAWMLLNLQAEGRKGYSWTSGRW